MANQGNFQRRSSFDWILWLKWVLATTLGWLLAWFLIGDIAVGAVIGIAQWLVLRSLVRQAGWWIVASTIGWLVGGVVLTAVPSSSILVLPGAVLGATTGIAQWAILRRWAYRGGRWVVTSILGWAIGPILGSPLVGAVVGAVTGFTLDWLMRRPRPEARHRPPID